MASPEQFCVARRPGRTAPGGGRVGRSKLLTSAGSTSRPSAAAVAPLATGAAGR